MLSDNIKSLRKNKGYTQEELADRINVVRQTVSKWEKGLSVPDAEALQKLADVLEVDIKELLGAPVVETQKSDEVVEQLARINEQLVIKNRRAHRIWKTIGIILAVIVMLNILLMVLFMGLRFMPVSSETGAIEQHMLEKEEKLEKEYFEE